MVQAVVHCMEPGPRDIEDGMVLPHSLKAEMRQPFLSFPLYKMPKKVI